MSLILLPVITSLLQEKMMSLIATATNANYQDYSAGLGGANGYTEVIKKTPTSVFLQIQLTAFVQLIKMTGKLMQIKLNLNLRKIEVLLTMQR